MDQAGHYRLTSLVYQLAAAAEEEAPLEEVAQPVMDQLQITTNETVNLCCLVGGQSVIVARKYSDHSVKLTSKLGQISGLHAGANPKAMLAFMPAEEQEKILSMFPVLQKYTEKTVKSVEALRMELLEIRQRGYSISDEDFEEGARGVGAAIFDRNGKVVGGISAGGPINRVGHEKLEHLGGLVADAARRISRLLGYMGDPVDAYEKLDKDEGEKNYEEHITRI